MDDDQAPVSTRPYLLRALHEWCTDNGLTPYIVVRVDDTVQVPREFVANDEIVLNISVDATGALHIGNDAIAFKARFGGKARDILVPVDRVAAIYARENGQGMAFAVGEGGDAGAPVPELPAGERPAPVPQDEARGPNPLQSVKGGTARAPADGPSPRPGAPAPKGGRPTLKRIK